MKISATGLNLIATFEGYSATPYKDLAGKMTIGFGHLIRPSERFTILTKAEAFNLLKTDTIAAEKAVNKYITISLSQDQFDALCSFVFNVGSEAFRASTLLKLLNKKEIPLACVEILKWVHVNKKVIQGLVNRRQVESKMLARI